MHNIENTFKNFARLPARVAIYVPGTICPIFSAVQQSRSRLELGCRPSSG